MQLVVFLYVKKINHRDIHTVAAKNHGRRTNGQS